MGLSIGHLHSLFSDVLEGLSGIGESYFNAGRLNDAVHVLAAGYELEEAADAAPTSYTKLLIMYGYVLTWQGSLMTGEYAVPLAILQRAVEQAHTLGETGTYAHALDCLGAAYYAQSQSTGSGDWTEAHDYFRQAMALRETLDDQAGLAESRFHVGLIAERERRYDDAVAAFTTVYEHAQKHSLVASKSEAARHLGFAAMRGHDYDAALRYFQEARDLMEAGQSRLFLPFAHLSIGEVLHVQQSYDRARHHYELANRLAEEMQVRRGQVQILYSLGEVAEDQHRNTQAHAYYEKAYDIANEIKFAMGIQLAGAKVQQFAGTGGIPPHE